MTKESSVNFVEVNQSTAGPYNPCVRPKESFKPAVVLDTYQVLEHQKMFKAIYAAVFGRHLRSYKFASGI